MISVLIFGCLWWSSVSDSVQQCTTPMVADYPAIATTPRMVPPRVQALGASSPSPAAPWKLEVGSTNNKTVLSIALQWGQALSDKIGLLQILTKTVSSSVIVDFSSTASCPLSADSRLEMNTLYPHMIALFLYCQSPSIVSASIILVWGQSQTIRTEKVENQTKLCFSCCM